MEKAVLLLTLLTAESQSTCTTRRCLAETLLKNVAITQPQDDNCTNEIYMPNLEYKTLSVDTKDLLLNVRLSITMVWQDPHFAWNTSLYPYNRAVLPVSKVWTPEIHITNSLESVMKPAFRDLLVYSNGTVEHSVLLTAKVNCEVNLFNYPFAADACPVALQTWNTDGCGSELQFNDFYPVDGSHGDWQTDYVEFINDDKGRIYILVGLSIKPSNPFITLLLPSILIIVADFVSFALPLGGGERNSFKVTLVLSFTVFLNILSDRLPGDSACAPIIRIHFCICLVMLVLSMLVSMLLTRVADEGGLAFCCCSKRSKNSDKKDDEAEARPDIAVFQVNSEESSQVLRKVGKFMDGFEAKEKKSERNRRLANTLEKTFFWFYFITGVSYIVGMITVMAKYECKINHFNFW